MNILMTAAEILLAIWFFGCLCTYKIGNAVLVEGEGIKSPEFVMFCLHVTGIVLFITVPAAGKWWLLSVLSVWFVLQFFSHWFYTIFGASEKKLKGYNEYFRSTVHWIPASDRRLIPDLYHTILHLLILCNTALTVWYIFR